MHVVPQVSLGFLPSQLAFPKLLLCPQTSLGSCLHIDESSGHLQWVSAHFLSLTLIFGRHQPSIPPLCTSGCFSLLMLFCLIQPFAASALCSSGQISQHSSPALSLLLAASVHSVKGLWKIIGRQVWMHFVTRAPQNSTPLSQSTNGNLSWYTFCYPS